MLHKRPLGGKKVQVTFTMQPLEGVEELYLCGEFNEWSERSTPLARGADGSWSVTLSLDAGRSYRFRYRDNRLQWHNDPSADAYVPNVFSSEDSVVDLAAVGAGQAEAARPAAAPKKKSPPDGRKGASAGSKKPDGGARPRKKKP